MCLKWAENACVDRELDPLDMNNRKKEMGEVFYCIPFYLMNPKEFVKIAAEFKDLFEKDELIELMANITSDGPIPLNKFKPNGQWVQQREVSSIKSYKKSVVVGIKPTLIFYNQTLLEYNQTWLSGIMTIAKQGEDDKVLLNQQIQIECRREDGITTRKIIKLTKPMDFETGATYLFNINFDSTWKERVFFTKQMDGESSQIVKFVCH